MYVECEDKAPSRMFRKCQSKGNSDYRETPTDRVNLSLMTVLRYTSPKYSILSFFLSPRDSSRSLSSDRKR